MPVNVYNVVTTIKFLPPKDRVITSRKNKTELLGVPKKQKF
jgi:hypothetical protein